ncbi:MAG: hypothetical protein IIY96_04485 [Lachnospiraceae bacterium]|jgi:hypothetical protein|nr:hypothetical protein [Lachnospiraceae bacterium]
MGYTIAYLEKDGTGYADNYPWVIMPPFETLSACQRDADSMIKAGYQCVTVFRASSSLDTLLEEGIVAWDYVKRNQVRCAGARSDVCRSHRRLVS